MDPLDKDGHIAILTDMATDYHQANAHLQEARQGLIAAVADAKAIKIPTAEIMAITKWSRAQVQGIAAYRVGSDTKQVPTDQAADDPADATV
jgi:hypothetical protein